MERRIAWEGYDTQELAALEQISAGYRAFLDAGKTERECIKESVRLAEKAGYCDLAEKAQIQPGDKVYVTGMGKTIALFHIGNQPLTEGFAILGAHIDSPRLDIKQNPLYEEAGAAYLDTHYYGGIKKYQWVTLPLAIHGVFAKKDGSIVEMHLGEAEHDPVFCVTDLLPHLGKEQLEKKGNKVVEGEDLDLICGSIPLSSAEKEKVKENVLALLAQHYGVEEEDFLSAELEVVPAGRAREAGFDRSLILAYGQDDRVCAYTSLAAQLALTETPEMTACCYLSDKEEIGSVGATGARSRFFENAVAELLAAADLHGSLAVRRALANSRVLSSDVSAAFDPLYPSVFEKKSAAYLGKGLVLNKFTGSGGKSGSNDTNAEYLAFVRRVLDEANVAWQTAELGKVDLGGGGTIAFLMAYYGMNVVDSGVAVLSMHAPWEMVSKADVYEAYRGYLAFLKA